MRFQQGRAELFKRPTFDLAHALLRDAELLAKRFQRSAGVSQSPLSDDAQLPLVKRAQRRLKPFGSALVIDRAFGEFVRAGFLGNEEVLPAGVFVFGAQRRV